MCKIMVFTNLSKAKAKDLPKLVNTIGRTLNEPHGFGYAIQGENGLFGERTLKTQSFKSALSRSLPEFNFLNRTYNRIGTRSPIIGAGIFHGRTSTNDKTLINTHPIQKHGWTVIHNGVVSDHGPKYNMITTNDTEHIVERLATGGIESIETHLTGYYAVAAFDHEGLLHVFRDDRAPLYFAEVETIGSYVFATTESSIEKVCSEMKWKVSVIQPLADNYYTVWNGNSLVSESTFQPRGATFDENKWATESLREFKSSYSGYSSLYSDSKETEPYSRDEMKFLEETETLDASYLILDYRENRIDLTEFRTYSPDEKLCCLIVRPDGTVMDPADYTTDTLYRGRIA